jgi:hypothetical protein
MISVFNEYILIYTVYGVRLKTRILFKFQSMSICVIFRRDMSNLLSNEYNVSKCNAMKKDFVISRIEASQDGAAYVYIALSDPNDFKPGSEKQQNPFGPNIMAFTSPEDLMKNLPKAMANISKAMGGSGQPTDSPTFKISMREYEDMAIKVGD